MDVTKEYNSKTTQYGGGVNKEAYAAASKSLNLVKYGSSIQNAKQIPITVYPYILTFEDKVGLFGTENVFIKIKVNMQDVNPAGLQDFDGYQPAVFNNSQQEFPDKHYVNYKISDDATDTSPYLKAESGNRFPNYRRPMSSVELKNLGVGNKYIDSFIDVALYDRNKNRISLSYGIIKGVDEFYIGVHARKGKRLPYRIQCEVGQLYTEYSELSDEMLLKVI